MASFKRRVGLAAAVVAATLVAPPAVLAQTAPVIEGGKTSPVFGYADAIRERVFIESPYDSDKNGVKDIIAIDIKRPKATNAGLKAPVIMDPSPYYSTLGRGTSRSSSATTTATACSTCGRCSTTTTSSRAATP